MNLLALDLGTTVGAAWHDGDAYRAVEWTLLEEAERRWCSPGLRFIRFRERLEQMLDSHKVDLVVYEKVMRHSSTYAAHVYGGLWATLTSTLDGRDVPYEGVSVGTAKKALTGHGGAGKEAMLAGAAALGVKCTGDNAADAVAILLAGEDSHGIVRLPEAARAAAVQRPEKRARRGAGRQRDRHW